MTQYIVRPSALDIAAISPPLSPPHRQTHDNFTEMPLHHSIGQRSSVRTSTFMPLFPLGETSLLFAKGICCQKPPALSVRAAAREGGRRTTMAALRRRRRRRWKNAIPARSSTHAAAAAELVVVGWLVEEGEKKCGVGLERSRVLHSRLGADYSGCPSISPLQRGNPA